MSGRPPVRVLFFRRYDICSLNYLRDFPVPERSVFCYIFIFYICFFNIGADPITSACIILSFYPAVLPSFSDCSFVFSGEPSEPLGTAGQKTGKSGLLISFFCPDVFALPRFLFRSAAFRRIPASFPFRYPSEPPAGSFPFRQSDRASRSICLYS